MEMNDKKTICIDLDGTIAYYDDWKGESNIGDPIPGVVEATKELKGNGWKIIIYTTRSNRKIVRSYLKKNNISFDFINENPEQPENAVGGKLYADIYLDDRAIQFNGDWSVTVKEILNFKPWMRRSEYHDNERNELAKTFLVHDFNQSYQQLRHYDNMSWDITKFTFLELLAGIAAVWAIYGFAMNPENPPSWIKSNYSLIIPSIFGICYIFSILASFLLSRNRVYFAKVAKYLNEHREFSLSIKPLGFPNDTAFYTNKNYPPAFDKWSTHLVSLYVIQIVSSCMFSAMIFCIIFQWLNKGLLIIIISALCGIISFVLNLRTYIKYMISQDNKFGK
jgi:hypothetical protein